jgi:hypothetical protein
VENIALRCRRHNQYEAELVFGRHRDLRSSAAGATRVSARSGSSSPAAGRSD